MAKVRETKATPGINLTKLMPEDVQAKYEVVGLNNRQSSCVVFFNHGKIDFKTISLKKAEYLVSTGFPYLKEKVSPKSEN